MSEEEVREDITDPYMNGEEFWLLGRRVDPYNVDRVMIYETEESVKEMANGTGRFYVDMVTQRIVAGEIGRHVTRKFIGSSPPAKEVIKKRRKTKFPSKEVFIVHGRDHKPLKELKSMLTGFGLNPIVLHEKASGSRTIVEKLERYSDVGYTFVILTPDDGSLNLAKLEEFIEKTEAKPISEKKKEDLLFDTLLDNLVKVARQNVILEFGYFMGLLGRDRVCCLYKGEVELPSDMHGIVYISFKESVNEVREKVKKELEEAGYKDLKLYPPPIRRPM